MAVMFVDMNSFFATCEQQINYWLRGRPVGVCVYPSEHGCVIAPSIEAKKSGVKTGMRLSDAMRLCPELVPLETHPGRYRKFHVDIMNVLKKYSDDVTPKSIDEAVVDFTGYNLIYEDLVIIAQQIKKDINIEVGDWLKCSIGIAPNAFMAKLASDIQKPDGLVVVTEENIDDVLKGLALTDLPGIARGMAERLRRGGINTPLELRHTPSDTLKRVCRSIVGRYWHFRLNFKEVDNKDHPYLSMQSMRQVSAQQRRNLSVLKDIFMSLCLSLEKRMMRNQVFARKVGFSFSYKNNTSIQESFITSVPLQDGVQLMNALNERMQKAGGAENEDYFFNHTMKSIGIFATDFIHEDLVHYNLFENHSKKDKLRKKVYEIKDLFGSDKILRAAEFYGQPVLKDAIGFGSIKDLHDDMLITPQV